MGIQSEVLNKTTKSNLQQSKSIHKTKNNAETFESHTLGIGLNRFSSVKNCFKNTMKFFISLPTLLALSELHTVASKSACEPNPCPHQHIYHCCELEKPIIFGGGRIKKWHNCISKTKTCPLPIVDCTWGPWGTWSACSKTCGGGTRTQTRIKSVVEANGGDCIGKNQQEETCNQEKCQTCDDDILTQNEEKIDCGGVCPACPEEVPQDVCKNYNGIPHKRRPVCCHKKCPECGGQKLEESL